MSKILTKEEACKSLRATAARHKALRMIAAEEGENLLQVTDKALEIGIRQILANPHPAPTTSPA